MNKIKREWGVRYPNIKGGALDRVMAEDSEEGADFMVKWFRSRDIEAEKVYRDIPVWSKA